MSTDLVYEYESRSDEEIVDVMIADSGKPSHILLRDANQEKMTVARIDELGQVDNIISYSVNSNERYIFDLDSDDLFGIANSVVDASGCHFDSSLTIYNLSGDIVSIMFPVNSVASISTKMGVVFAHNACDESDSATEFVAMNYDGEVLTNHVTDGFFRGYAYYGATGQYLLVEGFSNEAGAIDVYTAHKGISVEWQVRAPCRFPVGVGTSNIMVLKCLGENGINELRVYDSGEIARTIELESTVLDVIVQRDESGVVLKYDDKLEHFGVERDTFSVYDSMQDGIRGVSVSDGGNPVLTICYSITNTGPVETYLSTIELVDMALGNVWRDDSNIVNSPIRCQISADGYGLLIYNREYLSYSDIQYCTN